MHAHFTLAFPNSLEAKIVIIFFNFCVKFSFHERNAFQQFKTVGRGHFAATIPIHRSSSRSFREKELTIEGKATTIGIGCRKGNSDYLKEKAAEEGSLLDDALIVSIAF